MKAPFRALKAKRHNIILLSSCLAFIAAALLTVLLTSAFYQEMYGSPRVNGGKLDFSGYTSKELRDLPVGVNLSGDWEFFYNKWIVTEEYEGEPDGLIHLPGRWSGLSMGGRRLPKTGYASYRLTVTNLTDMKSLSVNCNNVAKVAYRTYINGELNTESGTMSTNIAEAFATGYRDANTYYRGHTEANAPLTIVIEVAANDQGGLTAPVWFNVYHSLSSTHRFEQFTLPNYLFAGMLVAILFCFLLPMRTLKKENALTVALFLAMLLLHYLVGVDFFKFTFDFLSLSAVWLPLARYITGALAVTANVYKLISDKTVSFKRIELIMLSAVNAVAAAAFFALMGTALQIIPIAVSLLTQIYVLYKTAFSGGKLGLSCINAFASTVLISLLAVEALDAQSLIVYTSEVLGSVAVFIIIILVAFLNFYKARESQRALIRAAKAETEIANMKKQSLKAQIKPHFIFNSLNAIKELYRKDGGEGEEMLSHFAAHLRANVDSDEKDLIPFEDELKNMINYFDLENLRLSSKLQLILNVEYADFCVPVLSLQPFLENAVKYGGTHDSENGYILISSALTSGGGVLVEVADNGVGFDPANIRKGAVGIKNATERLKYGLNAGVTVTSGTGNGTTVAISIPAQNVIPAAQTEVKEVGNEDSGS